jgi:uncharacterized repeat protein (TIGR01451 family)
MMDSAFHIRRAALTQARVWLMACLLGVWLFCALLGASSAHATAAPYQARIENIATASFTLENGETYSINSNMVTAVVARVPGVLLQSGQSVQAVAGSVVAFAHTVTNTGNAPDVFDLNVVQRPLGATVNFLYASLQLLPDANSDGIPDSLLPLTSTPVLQPGQRLSMVVLAHIPPGIESGAVSMMGVQARGQAAYAAAQQVEAAGMVSNINRTTVTAGADMRLTKHIDITRGPSPNSNFNNYLTFAIEYQNIGAATARQVEISDWIGQQGADFDTRGFEYIAGTARWNGLPLTDIQGVDPDGVDFSFGIEQPNLMKLTLDAVPPRTQGRLEFKVRVLPGLAAGSGRTTNVAQLRFLQPNNTPQQVASNLAYYSVEAVAGQNVDLLLSKKAVGANTIGQCSLFELQVSNQGGLPSQGNITVTDFLPAGLVYEPQCATPEQTLVSGGTSWTCQGGSGARSVSCTSPATVPIGSQEQAGMHPHKLQLVVRSERENLPALPALGMPVVLENRAVVSGGGESTALTHNNNTTAPLNVAIGATVRGMVWLDRNHDRRYVPADNDQPLENWRVEAVVNGVVLGAAFTGADGRYVISDLIPGQYEIRFRDPVSNIVNGRPVCNEKGLPSTQTSNCEKTSLTQTPSIVNSQGTALMVDLKQGDVIVEQSLPLDPSGVVYDSLTRQPIPGAKVVLLTPVGFDPAIHLVGGLGSLEQTVGPTGFYQYLLTSAGVDYCTARGACDLTLQVTPPAGYLTPPSSIIAPQSSVGGCALPYCLDPTGLAPAGTVYSVNSAGVNGAPQIGQPVEYFLSFRLAGGDPDVVNNHIPIDPLAAQASQLLLQKKADRDTVELGESVGYEIRLNNPALVAVPHVYIEDQLPAGFSLLPGSVRINGVAMADPASRGPKLRFELGTLAPSAKPVLTYRTVAGIGALQGTGINTAQAFSSSNFVSNRAQAKVRVTGGVFSEEAFLIGKVYLDCNRDGRQGQPDPDGKLPENEWGIPGVRLYLDNGSYAITDEEGKYSLYGLVPKTHALKLDTTTLPEGAELHAIDNRNRGDGSLRFVDPKKGELVRGDFAVHNCEPELLDRVAKRKEAILALSDGQLEWTQAVNQEFLFEPVAALMSNPRDRAATGVVSSGRPGMDRGPAKLLTERNYRTKPDTSPVVLAPTARQLYLAKLQDFDKWLPETDNQLAFVNVTDGDVLPDGQLTVQVKGRMGNKLVLRVNDIAVGDDKIGTRSTLEDKQSQALEFVSISLNPGDNRLTLTESDPFGIERGRLDITLRVPGQLAKLAWDVPAEAKSDVPEPLLVRLQILDAEGLPVNARLPITLEIKGAQWQETDLDPIELGTQIFVQDGLGLIKIKPPSNAGDVTVTALHGTLKSQATIKFLPNLRPMVAAGLVEGAIALRKLDPAQIVPVREPDSFEKIINGWSRTSDDGKRHAGLRGSLFLKGEVKGEYLLTLAYDSDRDLNRRMFRDIAPDVYYPVYGDASERGWDAQSTQRLYVRIDKNKSWILYGDYNTQSTDTGGGDSRQLASVSRSLTGAKWHYEDDQVRVNVHVSQDSLRQYVIELAANGTSGPFALLGEGGLVNSEKVEIITRDRNALGQVVAIEALQRFVDYEIEPFNQSILFKAPVASFDGNLNPRFIKVTYEVDQGGEPFWIAGLDTLIKVNDSVSLGGAVQRDHNPMQPLSVYGLSMVAKLTRFSTLTAELASTDRHGVANSQGIAGHDSAARLVFKQDDTENNTQLSISATRTGLGFDNPTSSMPAGRLEIKVVGKQKINADHVLEAEGNHSDDLIQGNQRQHYALRLGSQLAPQTRLTLSVNELNEQVMTANGMRSDALTSLGAKLQMGVAALPGLGIFLETEQSLDASKRETVSVGGDYKYPSNTRVYGRYDLVSDLRRLANPLTDSRPSALVGIELPYSTDGRAFTEYRARDGIDGPSTEAAMGLRQTVKINNDWRASGSFERVEPLTAAAAANESVAVTMAVEYLNDKDLKYTGRVERREAASTDSWLIQHGLALRHNSRYTSLGRLYWSQQNNRSGADIDRWRVMVGFAYRDDVRDDLSWLARMEHRYEDNAAAATPFERDTWIFGLNTNYRIGPTDTLTQHWAYKWSNEKFPHGVTNNSRIGLVFGRYTRNVTKRLDLDLHGGLMLQRKPSRHKTSLGLEAGYLLSDNLWFSIGYNWFGFHDRDLTENDYTQRGIYLRLRWKFG